MTDQPIDMDQIREYFAGKLEQHGATPRGVDWNSTGAQDTRFSQLAKVIAPLDKPFSLLDYGSGFGSFYEYLVSQGIKPNKYVGFDIVEGMVTKGRELHANKTGVVFQSSEADLPVCDYVVASGIFNIKLDTDYDQWTAYVVKTISRMNDLADRGFSMNFLTKYSDADHMRSDLYYADPGYIFDVCKRRFSRNVAILHDYDLYDFTVVVRKKLD
ncbi:MAG TPA: class I SAM-dependent methyltransferase [Leptolinea sp.]